MPKPMLTKKKFWMDRISAFGVHFFFGAVLGSAFGLGFWIFRFADTESTALGLRCIAGGAAAGGLLAGIARDRFWRDLRKKGRPHSSRKTGSGLSGEIPSGRKPTGGSPKAHAPRERPPSR